MPENLKIVIENDLRPAYYDDFHCLAKACKISCCKGWSIVFDKKDYLSLKRQKGSAELNERLERDVRRIRKGPNAGKFFGEFDMSSGICSFLREDGLCSLQMEKGHEALPYVCRNYPRNSAYQPSGYLERSLSPSCEGVLALLWNLKEGIEFRSDPLPKEKQKTINIAEGSEFFLYFSVVRSWCVDLLQNRKFSIPQRIWIMGMGLNLLAEGEMDIQHWMERAAALPDNIDGCDLLPSGDQELAIYLNNCVQTLMQFRNNDPNLSTVQQEVLSALKMEYDPQTGRVTYPLAPYREARERYNTIYAEREYFMENLMVSIFFCLLMPNMGSREALWKSYVDFCSLYGIAPQGN